MNLEVGMYIRTEKGNIGQIENITDYNVWTTIYLFPFNKETNSANDEKITKASYNIIDLIDLSDYVNNEKVTEICSSSNYKAVCINSFYKNSRKKYI